MKRKCVLGLIMAAFLAGGCAGIDKYVPSYALTKSAESVSIPHPVEMERKGVRVVTIFTGVMEPGLWVEVVAGGGVWPTLALGSNDQLYRGYACFKGVNYWGDFLLLFIFPQSRDELAGAKFLYFNRDGGLLYQLSGSEIRYNPKKFDKDRVYRTGLFNQFGRSLSELDNFWLAYLEQKGISPPDDLSSIKETAVNSRQDWQFAKMNYHYKMPDGSIRVGYLPLEKFRQVAVEIPGFNGPGRFLKRAKLPLMAVPFAGVGALASVAASIVGDAVSAAIDDDWSGYYARAKTLRYQLAPAFRQMAAAYKELLRKRDERIRWLEFKLDSQMTFGISWPNWHGGRR